MKTARIILTLPALVITCLLQTVVAQQEMVTVTVRSPEHGSLRVNPALPTDGRIPAGTQLQVTATPDPRHC